MPNRVPLVMSGAAQRIARLHSQPDPCGADRPDRNAPGRLAARRSTGALPPTPLDMDDRVQTRSNSMASPLRISHLTRLCCACSKGDVKTQRVDAIDTLEPFHTAELTRAG